MKGRTPERTKTVRLMRDGVIADLDAAAQMIALFIDKPGISHCFVQLETVQETGDTSTRQLRNARKGAQIIGFGRHRSSLATACRVLLL